jgi:hypothetical protein
MGASSPPSRFGLRRSPGDRSTPPTGRGEPLDAGWSLESSVTTLGTAGPRGNPAARRHPIRANDPGAIV